MTVEQARPTLLAAGVWLVLVAVALLTRPPLPVDETRYLAVAWEMHVSGNYLVPHLNGAPYSHKPPLLFWIINLGWAVFGTAEWWARLAAPLFTLGCLVLVQRLAARLWPERAQVAALAPVVLIGNAFWATIGTMALFDMLVAFFTLAALIGVVAAERRGGWLGWLIAGAALGLGILAKGPVALVYILPAPLAAPLWATPRRPHAWLGWYAGLIGAVALGAAIALAWALPAARAGGEAYGNAILWHQTAGRISDSFAHERAWWFYLAVLAGGLLPWAAWPPLWRAMRRGRALFGDAGSRFCLTWLLLAGIALSFISGKQPHYLAPLLPAAALLVAAFLSADGGGPRRRDGLGPAILFAIPAVALVVLLALGQLPATVALPDWVYEINPLAGLALILAAIVAAVLPAADVGRRAARLAIAAALFVVAVHVTVQPHLARAFDVTPAARAIAALQRQGVAVAVVGKYHGQFHFPGRLERPVDAVWEHQAGAWAAAHPGGRLVAYQKPPADNARAEVLQAYRNGALTLWDAATIAAEPSLIDR